MSKKIQLTIPKPCHENWDAMTPVEKGKFCGSCQKQVVDFSNMSDREIAVFFKKPSNGSVCGRFMSDQLDRDIEIPKKRIPWVKYFFQILLPAFFVSKASAEKTQGKIAVKPSRDTIQKPVVNDPVILGEISTRNITPVCVKPPVLDTVFPVTGFTAPNVQGDVTKNVFIRGTVVDDSGLPLPGATVMIKGTRTGMATEINGLFSLKPPKDWKELTLVVSYIGFTTKEIFISRNNNSNLNKIVLLPESTPSVVVGAVISYINEKMVTGSVVDEEGKPVPFASIETNQPGKGVMADENGYFRIQAGFGSGDTLLIVTSVGFERKEVSIAGQENYTQALIVQMTAKSLAPVVVETYGTTIKGMVLGGYSVIRKSGKSAPLIKEKESTPSKYFKVFPNPLPAGSNLTIDWKQSEEGYFNLQLLNASGQVAYQQELWIDADARLLNIDLPQVAAGNYFLVLTSKKSGKRFTEKLIIQ